MPLNKHDSSISRLSSLLEYISTQAEKTDQLNSKKKSHRLLENNNLFSQHLFSTESDKISQYVGEVKRRLTEFSRLYASSNTNSNKTNTNKSELAKSALSHIEQQISALMNAIQANQAMHHAAQVNLDIKKNTRIKAAKLKATKSYDEITKSVVLSSHQLYQQLNEHHEFERRLRDMITEREQQRAQAKVNNTHKLSQEVLALHQRLGRCLKAISKIELNIEQAEKGILRR